MARTALSGAELDARMSTLNGWTHNPTALLRTFRFESFPDAMAFMQRVSYDAERLDHHPEWKNVYDCVWVELTTHDAGGITERDFALAREMDTIYAHFTAHSAGA